jgi:hypothetical protein
MKKKNYIFLLFLFIGLTAKAQWQQIGSEIYGEEIGDLFGGSVSLSSDGSVLAIGARFNDGDGNDKGHVRVFKNNSGAWGQIGNDIDGEADNDYFGESVSLSSDGSIVAIGSSYNDGNGSSAGHVRVFQNNSDIWEQIGDDIDGETASDSSGLSISLSSSGSIIAIGAPFNDGKGNDSGHVRVFKNNSGIWEQIGEDINGEAIGDLFGWSINISNDGSVLAAGAPSNDGNGNSSGHVRVFQNNSGAWDQVGDDIDGEASYDISGSSVSLSSDGFVVAIGAIWNDENGTSSGHVRVFQNNSGIWEQKGDDINGEAIADFLGESVSLSSDGSIVAVGAGYNDDNGTDSGHVRVFQNDNVLGIFETEYTPDISFYPNPTNNSFIVKSKKLIMERITISDITGKEVYNYNSKIINNGFETDISNLESAIYIISIQTEKGVFTTKIIKM